MAEQIIFFDTEWTTWPGALRRKWSRLGEYREIVQIGAVRLNQVFEEIESLELIVKPKKNPILSEYFVELTGIDQKRVDEEGSSFVDAWAQFFAFLTRNPAAIYSNGGDDIVLRENFALNDISDRTSEISFWNIQPWFRQVSGAGVEFVPSNRFLAVLGIGGDLKAHDALADVRTVTRAVRAMRHRGAAPLPHEIPSAVLGRC